VLIFAHDLIEQKPAYENYILHALNEVEIGAQFHTNLENRIYCLFYENMNKSACLQ